MVETAIIMTPNEFDRLTKRICDQVTADISNMKGLIVEQPMTTQEAAGFMKISEDTLFNRMKSGLPYHRDGKILYFFPSELVQYIKSKNKKR